MLEKVMVATDLSEPSIAVLDYVPRLRGIGLEKVVLAHVVEIVGSGGAIEPLMQSAEELIANQADRLRDSGLEVETDVQVGRPATKIAIMAEEHGVSGLIVGSQGRSMIKRILLGSVAMSLLHHASVPVLIVRMDLCETEEGISCDVLPAQPHSHILFPTDFSEAADAAFEWMKSLVLEWDSRVTLLHAEDIRATEHEIAGLEEYREEDRRRLQALADELHEAGVDDVSTMVDARSPAPFIADTAEQDDVSLIVMATHGQGVLEELVLGSVALKVARISPVPVLMLPQRFFREEESEEEESEEEAEQET